MCPQQYGPAGPLPASAVTEEGSIRAGTITSLIRRAKPAPTSQSQTLRRFSSVVPPYVERSAAALALDLPYWREMAQADGRPSRRLRWYRARSTPRVFAAFTNLRILTAIFSTLTAANRNRGNHREQ